MNATKIWMQLCNGAYDEFLKKKKNFVVQHTANCFYTCDATARRWMHFFCVVFGVLAIIRELRVQRLHTYMCIDICKYECASASISCSPLTSLFYGFWTVFSVISSLQFYVQNISAFFMQHNFHSLTHTHT